MVPHGIITKKISALYSREQRVVSFSQFSLSVQFQLDSTRFEKKTRLAQLIGCRWSRRLPAKKISSTFVSRLRHNNKSVLFILSINSEQKSHKKKVQTSFAKVLQRVARSSRQIIQQEKLRRVLPSRALSEEIFSKVDHWVDVKWGKEEKKYEKSYVKRKSSKRNWRRKVWFCCCKRPESGGMLLVIIWFVDRIS